LVPCGARPDVSVVSLAAANSAARRTAAAGAARLVAAAAAGTLVGESAVFASHCWGARWGDVVAALAQATPPGGRVWVDLFAVRQHPGNGADLGFRGVVGRCGALVCVVSDRLPGTKGLSWAGVTGVEGREKQRPPEEERKMIAFFRIW